MKLVNPIAGQALSIFYVDRSKICTSQFHSIVQWITITCNVPLFLFFFMFVIFLLLCFVCPPTSRFVSFASPPPASISFGPVFVFCFYFPFFVFPCLAFKGIFLFCKLYYIWWSMNIT